MKDDASLIYERTKRESENYTQGKIDLGHFYVSVVAYLYSSKTDISSRKDVKHKVWLTKPDES